MLSKVASTFGLSSASIAASDSAFSKSSSSSPSPPSGGASPFMIAADGPWLGVRCAGRGPCGMPPGAGSPGTIGGIAFASGPS